MVQGALLLMTLNKLKVALIVALTMALTTGIAVAILQTSRASRVADTAPKNTAAAVNEPEWRAAFDRAYALAPDQTVRFVKPPFIPERIDFYRAVMTPSQVEAIPNGPDFLVLQQGDSPGAPVRFRSCSFGIDTVGNVMELVLGVESHEISAPRKLLDTAVHGDWVLREGSTTSQRARALEQVLREDANLLLKVERRRKHGDVIVIRGTLTVVGRPVQIYSDKTDPGEGEGGAAGPFSGFVHRLGQVTGCKVVNESSTAPDTQVQWASHASGYVSENMPPKRAAAKIDLILTNVSRQSGLQLRRETRTVEVWEVTAANETAKTN